MSDKRAHPVYFKNTYLSATPWWCKSLYPVDFVLQNLSRDFFLQNFFITILKKANDAERYQSKMDTVNGGREQIVQTKSQDDHHVSAQEFKGRPNCHRKLDMMF